MSGPSLKDVPDRYDVVFQLDDGTTYGFLLADSVESNLPFRTHKALYSYSPTFLERQNVSNVYGDNFQDFFLTGSQDDFSLGQNQKFFRVNDQNRARRYWADTGVDPVTVPGNVTLSPDVTASFAQSGIVSICPNSRVFPAQTNDWFAVGGTNAYTGTYSSASLTSLGAHSCPSVSSTVVDGNNLYIGSSATDSTAVIRRWDGASFTTFSSLSGGAISINSMVFLNNILFGFSAGKDALYSFDNSGTPTAQFTWEDARGNPNQHQTAQLIPYGGSIYILRGSQRGSELWQYDGSGCLMLAEFPRDFVGKGLCVSNGIVFCCGGLKQTSSGYLPQVYYYVNGSLGMLWQTPNPQAPAAQIPQSIEPTSNGAMWIDPSTMNLMQYDISLGGVHTVVDLSSVSSFTDSDNIGLVASALTQAVLIWDYTAGKGVIWSHNNDYPSSAVLQTSQYDFDNTLAKIVRGIKVDIDTPTNTSVDIGYQLDGCGGTYTSLKTGATSGTEYLLPASTTAHSVSVQATLNSSTGTATPTLKRVYVRAAPLLEQFRKREYLFDFSGGVREDLGKSSRVCRDGSPYPYDPFTAADNLKTVALQTVPFTVVDKFSLSPGFTCLADLEQNQEGYDGFAIYEVRPNVYIGRINVREV